jgi:hypothetical protein
MKSAPVQKLLSEFSNNSFSQFSFDLCEAFLLADIPLWKITMNTFDPKSTASIQITQDVLKNAELETNIS